MSLSRRSERIGESATLKVAARAAELRSAGEDILDFSVGEPDFATPAHVKRAGHDAIDADFTRYTPNRGTPQLRQAIVDKFHRDNALDYGLDQVLVSSGAKASLYFAIQALFGAGDEVVVPAPYWVSYPEQLRLADAEPVFVTMREEDGFRLSPQALEAALTERTRGVILNYPSNPTGASYRRQDLEALAEVCLRRDLWVVADEIYEKLLYADEPFTSIAAVDPRMRERTVVINGMSKAFAMTGWRIGFAAGPKTVIGAMARLQSHCTSNATSIAQWASREALVGGDDAVRAMAGSFRERRDAIRQALTACPGVTCANPDGAFYAFPSFAGALAAADASHGVRTTEELALYLLEQAGVATVPGEAFGAPGHLRFSFAASVETIERGMERVRSALAGLAAPKGE